MADQLMQLRDAEIAEADTLAAVASAQGVGCVGASTIAASRKALAIAGAVRGTDAINTSALDLRSIRSDVGLQNAVQADLAQAQAILGAELPRWIVAGWEREASGQKAILAPGIVLHVDLTADDKDDIRDYPIQGHSPTELIAHNVRMLKFDLDGAVAQCIIAKSPDAIIGAIGTAGQQNGNRWAMLCREAYFAGAQAARLDIAAALSGKT